MSEPNLQRQRWIAPILVGGLGIVLSYVAFWMAERAEDKRVQTILEFRSEWRARDLEAKIRLSANAVENIAIAMASNVTLGRDQFSRFAARAHRGLEHVNSLQWAPRVKREQIASFEQSARAITQGDYRVFDVTPEFQRTDLSDRPEYFPVLFDERFHGERRVLGLALGKYEGRRIPMERARDEGKPVATLPVRPIGKAEAALVYLVFWPVYGTIDVPATPEDRRTELRGYAIGNYDLIALLTAATKDTPELIETIHIAVSAGHEADPVGKAVAVYSPEMRKFQAQEAMSDGAANPAVRIQRDFEVLHQHWDLTFDFSEKAIAGLRSQGAWGWLLAGLLLTGSLVVYLIRERGRTQTIEMLVASRTAELAHTSEQLHQAQKMEAIGNLTGGMAHDFNNLLSVVIGNLDMLQAHTRNDPEATSLAEAALQASLRGAELTRQLLAFARRQPLVPQIIDMNELVSGTIRLLERILEEHIEVKLITAPDLWPVLIDPAQLTSAIANLATNARDAMPKGGLLTIETKNTHLDTDYAALNPEVVSGDYVLLEVSDTGTGMSPETLARVFEPFFTTKAAEQGTGLGLSMVFGFVKQSQGHIKIYSESQHGTIVRIYLPRSQQPVAVVSPAIADEPSQPRRENILVVEDNAGVRDVVMKQLTSLGYAVLEADSAQEALAMLKYPELRVDLLFTDLVMPGGMNGSELARIATADRPALLVLFTSGYSDSILRGDDRLKEGQHFLSKPYRKQDLAQKLRGIFGH